MHPEYFLGYILKALMLGVFGSRFSRSNSYSYIGESFEVMHPIDNLMTHRGNMIKFL
jgi:hypothetical protein